MSETVRLSLLLLCVGLLTACTRAPVAQSGTQSALAMVNGQPIYDEDLTPFIKNELEELKRQEYNLKVKALDRAIEQKILALEADKKKTTVDRLLAAEVDNKVSEPTESQIVSYYQSQKDSLKVPLDQIRPQISQLLKQISINEARQGYVAELRQQAVINSNLTAPRAKVEPDPARIKGNPEALVTIVEFSDYQCPYCRQAEPTVRKLLEEYGDRIRFSYRDVPLANIHPRAEPAAEASRCAGD